MELKEQVDAIREDLKTVIEQGMQSEYNALQLVKRAVKLAIYNPKFESAASAALDCLEQLQGLFPVVVKAGWTLAGKGVDLTLGYVQDTGFMQEVGAPSAFSRLKTGKIIYRTSVSLAVQKLWKSQGWDGLYLSQIKVVRVDPGKFNSPETLKSDIERLLKAFDRRKYCPTLTQTDFEIMEKATSLLRESISVLTY